MRLFADTVHCISDFFLIKRFIKKLYLKFTQFTSIVSHIKSAPRLANGQCLQGKAFLTYDYLITLFLVIPCETAFKNVQRFLSRSVKVFSVVQLRFSQS